MTNPAGLTHARLGHFLLCSLALFGLAACGADDAGSSTAATSSTASLSPQVGMIDRQPNSQASSASGVQAPPTAAVNPTTGPQPQPGIPPVKVADGSATLDWTPPTENSDGSVLTNLAGYTVYYGTAPDKLTQSVKLTNPGLTAYTVSNLSSGTWYFSVSSYSASGVESTRTGVVSTKI